MRLMDMGCMIWRVTFGNGVRIGMERTIIVVHQLRIRQGRTQAPGGCCGVVIGSTLLATCGWLTATTTVRLVGTTTTGFDVCQDRSSYP